MIVTAVEQFTRFCVFNIKKYLVSVFLLTIIGQLYGAITSVVIYLHKS